MANSIPGPRCPSKLSLGLDAGTNNTQATAQPGPVCGFSVYPEMYVPGFGPAALGMAEAITDADREEFKLLALMPALDQHHRPYLNVRQYVSDRTLFFGAPSTYQTFATESDAELANTVWGKKHKVTLQSQVEMNTAKQLPAQPLFYRWVRQAYKARFGKDKDVTKFIQAGWTDHVVAAIAAVRSSVRVKKIHAEGFHTGGSNPRPVKFSNHYLLGTLSDHAIGLAVDVDDKQNAQLTAKEWAYIEQFAGLTVPRKDRCSTEANVEAFWKDIKKLNDLFVKKVAEAVAKIEKEQAEKAKTEPPSAAPPPPPPPVAPAKGHHKHHELTPHEKILQKVLGAQFDRLHEWADGGFFHHPLDLVLEFHAHGFIWGAGFSTNADLHHFELHGIDPTGDADSAEDADTE